jgi:hypothetical protein
MYSFNEFKKKFNESFSLAPDEYKYKLYHGTNALFSEFKVGDNRNGNAYGKGIYFTDNLDYAEFFGNNVYLCEIIMYNPFDMTAKNMEHFLKIRQFIKDKEELKYFDEAYKNKNYMSALNRLRHNKIFNNKMLKKLGYDGIIGHCERGGKEYIVFSPMQTNILKLLK